jgi:DhnA family fructose-bisphosphate aldolase class Ia
MKKIVDSCPAPILVAGGARDESNPDAALRLARDVNESGASGMIIGRNVYQSPDPGKTLGQLREIFGGTNG